MRFPQRAVVEKDVTFTLADSWLHLYIEKSSERFSKIFEALFQLVPQVWVPPASPFAWPKSAAFRVPRPTHNVQV